MIQNPNWRAIAVMAAFRAWYLNVALLGLAWFGAAGKNLDWKMELEWDGAWRVYSATPARFDARLAIRIGAQLHVWLQ